jgi:hypothetical protein
MSTSQMPPPWPLTVSQYTGAWEASCMARGSVVGHEGADGEGGESYDIAPPAVSSGADVPRCLTAFYGLCVPHMRLSLQYPNLPTKDPNCCTPKLVSLHAYIPHILCGIPLHGVLHCAYTVCTLCVWGLHSPPPPFWIPAHMVEGFARGGSATTAQMVTKKKECFFGC